MKRIALIAAFSAFATACMHGQANLAGAIAGPPQSNYINPIRVADLPPIVPSLQNPDQRHLVGGFVVKDGTTATDCTVGGSTHVVLCISNGTTYTGSPFGGGSGGGATIDNTTNLVAGDGAGNGVDSTVAPSNVLTKTGNLGGLSSVSAARTALGLGAAAQLALSTVIANPGVDTKVASEKAVRDLFNTAGGGTTFVTGPNNTLVLSGGVLDTTSFVPQTDQNSDILADWIYHIGLTLVEQATCDTPAASSIVFCASTSDHALHYKTSDGTLHDFGSGGGAFHAVKATQSAGQVIPGSYVATPLEFDQNVSITDGSMHSVSSNKANFVVPSTGWYAGTCNVVTSSNGGEVFFWITVNGAKIIGTHHKATDVLANGFGEAIPFDYQMTSGDVVQCVANGGSTFTTANAGLEVVTNMSLYLVH